MAAGASCSSQRVRDLDGLLDNAEARMRDGPDWFHSINNTLTRYEFEKRQTSHRWLRTTTPTRARSDEDLLLSNFLQQCNYKSLRLDPDPHDCCGHETSKGRLPSRTSGQSSSLPLSYSP